MKQEHQNHITKQGYIVGGALLIFFTLLRWRNETYGIVVLYVLAGLYTDKANAETGRGIRSCFYGL
jgi:hypothetical protein